MAMSGDTEKRAGTSWINCKDKFPPHNKYVLVFGQNRMSIACLRVDGGWYVRGFDETDHTVTHWRYVKPPMKRRDHPNG